jgi:ketosteroid isomerase-like protein
MAGLASTFSLGSILYGTEAAMVEEEDIELVRTAYDAFVAGDMEWLNEHLHENIVWHAAGRSSLAGEYRGREEVLASLAKSVQIAMPAFEIHDVAASEDHAVTVLDVTWRRPDGEAFEGKAVQVFHVGGGKFLESWFIPEDQAGLDAFLEGESA